MATKKKGKERTNLSITGTYLKKINKLATVESRSQAGEIRFLIDKQMNELGLEDIES